MMRKADGEKQAARKRKSGFDKLLDYYWNQGGDLAELDLHNKEVDDEDAILLSKNCNWRNLSKFNLSRNKIGDDGTVTLSKNTNWTKLMVLNLRKNGMDCQIRNNLFDLRS